MTGCTRTKQTSWTEDQFTVTSSAGIRNREKRVADIVVRELKRAKPDVWGYIQSREVWSSEEETNMRPGHFWICNLGTFPGSMTCVERKFELQGRKCKWEEYKVTRYSDGDSALVVELWLHRVADDLSGHKCSGGNVRQLERVARRGLPPHGSEVSSTRRGGSWKPSYVRCGSEKTSGCG